MLKVMFVKCNIFQKFLSKKTFASTWWKIDQNAALLLDGAALNPNNKDDLHTVVFRQLESPKGQAAERDAERSVDLKFVFGFARYCRWILKLITFFVTAKQPNNVKDVYLLLLNSMWIVTVFQVVQVIFTFGAALQRDG